MWSENKKKKEWSIKLIRITFLNEKYTFTKTMNEKRYECNGSKIDKIYTRDGTIYKWLRKEKHSINLMVKNENIAEDWNIYIVSESKIPVLFQEKFVSLNNKWNHAWHSWLNQQYQYLNKINCVFGAWATGISINIEHCHQNYVELTTGTCRSTNVNHTNIRNSETQIKMCLLLIRHTFEIHQCCLGRSTNHLSNAS